MASKKFYVVWKGRQTGIFNTWDDCKRSIEGFPGAQYKSFPGRTEAEQAFSHGPPRYSGLRKEQSGKSRIARGTTMASGNPHIDSICVDAACSGNPGKMEYRGVDTQSREEIFHRGPFPEGTNNIGEFLAIVHGLAILQKQQLPTKIIYSDSKIAIGWVKKKKCGTKLQPNKRTEELLELVHRAEQWLLMNAYFNPILKWETEKWGEIPADFGRK